MASQLPLKESVLRLLEKRDGRPSTSQPVSELAIPDHDEKAPRPYVAQIQAVGGRYGLERSFLRPPVKASGIADGSVFEVRIGDSTSQTRHYYVLENGTFMLFAVKSMESITFEQERASETAPPPQPSESTTQKAPKLEGKSRFQIPAEKPILYELICKKCGGSFFAVADTDLLPEDERPKGYTITQLECVVCFK